jgi:hypothetical protein
MNINLELLIADLAQKLRLGVLDPKSLNLESDLRGIITSNQRPVTESAALTSPAASGNMGALS